jgi:PAS domain S-box-containing protein
MQSGKSPREAPALAIPREFLLDLFNSVSDGVVAVDNDLKVAAINRAALEMLGFQLHEALGRSVADVFSVEENRGQCVIRETIRSGRALIDREVLVSDRQGRHVPVLLTTSLVRGPKGEILGGAATFRNLAKVRQLAEAAGRARPFGEIVTGDPEMRRLFGTLPTIARADSSVLVLGETGTGKGLLVRALHDLSPRRQGPLVTVNCAALPETLLEAELFGVRAGAYTGATQDRQGRLEAADGGTLFLDEIGDIPPGVQVKLLRVLQEKVYERVGDVRPRVCDVRFVTATHRDLESLVETGAFRRDLYYRINVLSVEIPPLRDRKGDIPLLAQRFLDRLTAERGKTVSGVSSRVLEILTAHDYPGNIRELENIVEHGWVMCDSEIVEPVHLPRELVPQPDHPLGKEARAGGLPRLEAEYLRQVLRRHHGNRQAAARELGIHRTTLQRRIKRLGLTLAPGDGRSGPKTHPG